MAGRLMTNHLLIRTAGVPLATSMRRLLTGYAMAFNRRHRRHGQLFLNRYKSILCQLKPAAGLNWWAAVGTQCGRLEDGYRSAFELTFILMACEKILVTHLCITNKNPVHHVQPKRHEYKHQKVIF